MSQYGLLQDGTLVIETGAQFGLLPFGVVVETVEETPSTQYNISKINSIAILSIGKINSRLLSGVKRVMGVNVQTT